MVVARAFQQQTWNMDGRISGRVSQKRRFDEEEWGAATFDSFRDGSVCLALDGMANPPAIPH